MATSTKPQTKSKLHLPICLWAIGLVPASLAQVPGTPTMWHVRSSSLPIGPVNCSGLAGGTWVTVPGNAIYGTSDFCVQKYVPTNVNNIPTSRATSSSDTPWVNISQTSAKTTCSSLGIGYHLITNPEWMTIAANIANVASNWSGSVASVDSGELARGHSDANPNQACAADADDSKGWVETNCTGQTQGNLQFRERRTRTLSNGQVIWDIGGNVWHWVDAYDPDGKPGNAAQYWNEYSAIGIGTTSWPRSALVPLNSTQSWWNDSWNSAQSIGQINPGTNGSGGALRRGGDWDSVSFAGKFAANLGNTQSYSGTDTSFRCAYSLP